MLAELMEERQFRRIIGYQQLAALALAIEREFAFSVMIEEVATLISARESHRDRRPKFYDARGTLTGEVLGRQ